MFAGVPPQAGKMFIENRGKAITFKGLVRETGSGGTPGGITMHW